MVVGVDDDGIHELVRSSFHVKDLAESASAHEADCRWPRLRDNAIVHYDCLVYSCGCQDEV